ncbi:stage II sporulation protein D [Clostridium sp. P21]|uniref:Stage II sporulation protein D n=1 Tax=Clostridium muellerianum TaxID=2716538 RepID=A0A7Y0EDQ2_9CLOT|nr:stage II sporulation protein D [Clostridium muellerianum]NMM61537.1 stage II sporulation protein D [Clostridium muellerianum]
MKRVSGLMYLKKLMLLIFIGIILVIALSLFILEISEGGIGINRSIPKFLIKSNDVIFNKQNVGDIKIKVYITKENKVEEMCLEEYVKGVVSAEEPVEFSLEALKAQAVAARTFALAHMESFGGHKYKSNTGADVCDTTQCQVFRHKEEQLKLWEANKRDEYWNKISNAVQQTSGEFLVYDNKLVMEPYYFSVSSGKTEDCLDVFSSNLPYLKSVSSLGEEGAYKRESSIKVSYSEFINKISYKYTNCGLSTANIKNEIQIKSRTKGGSIKEMAIGKITISGTEFRSIMGLNSANFNIKYNDTGMEIDCKGYGHGVGMSQWGANAMAKSGSNYKEILKHYYSGVEINKISR